MPMDSGGFGGYTPPSSGGSGFRPIGNQGFGIQPLGTTPLGGDVHETFKVNELGEISGGHTTVRIPGGQSVQIPWGG